jgi:fumarate hydratase class II
MAPSAPEPTPPAILDVPIGLDASGMRPEADSLGEVLVPADRYWGAQTQRALTHFAVDDDPMPIEVVRAYATVKKAAAMVNAGHGRLAPWKAEVIARVCDEIAAGLLDDQFPLSVWQSGSGTQTHVNVNEVVANRCIQLLGGQVGSRDPIHPNDDVNMGQSSNDTFPTAMHIAGYRLAMTATVPALRRLQAALDAKARRWASVVKVGRTHLQDATPLTVGQQWSGYVAAVGDAADAVEYATAGLLRLAVGGTAVGTGLNAPAGFGAEVAAVIADLTGFPFESTPNPFAAQATVDDLVRAHASLKTAAVTLFKIANDLRWLGSGPRAGLGELKLPANEPGSSIMPGKVNPTQAEVVLMVCIQVMGADVAVQMAGAEGNFELNTFRPVVIDNYLRSARTLAGAVDRFSEFMVAGAELDRDRLAHDLERSVMLVTALSPVIGYDRAAVIAHDAVNHDLTLRQAALRNGVSAELFDRVVVPGDLTGPDRA